MVLTCISFRCHLVFFMIQVLLICISNLFRICALFLISCPVTMPFIVSPTHLYKHIINCIMEMLSIMVPNDSVIDHYLYDHPEYTMTDNSLASVVYSYGGRLLPLAEIQVLLSMFDPQQYTISKSMTGISFIVWPSE